VQLVRILAALLFGRLVGFAHRDGAPAGAL